MASIHFFTEEIKFILPEKLKLKKWIEKIILSEKAQLIDLNFIFCPDTYLHQLNLQYLNHDDFTDILTFNRSERKGKISGDIYISIERIKENAIILDQDLNLELNRVIIHGVLHLLGYNDKDQIEKGIMTQKENEALELWHLLDVPRGTSSRSNF